MDQENTSVTVSAPKPEKRKKRTILQREEDLAVMGEMISLNKTPSEIAAQIGAIRPYRLTLDQINNDINCLNERWLKKIGQNGLIRKKAHELMMIERDEREALEAWNRSKADFMAVVQKSDMGIASEPNGKPVSKTVTKEKRDGDPRFLQALVMLRDQKIKLLGLDAPMKIDISGEIKGGYTLESLREIYSKHILEKNKIGTTVVDVESVQVEHKPEPAEKTAEDESGGIDLTGGPSL